MQQKVVGCVGTIAPMGSLSVVVHAPGVYVTGPIDLDPSVPAAKPKQTGAVPLSVADASGTPSHVSFSYTASVVEQLPGSEVHAQAEHDRPSIAPE
jgi:hypothetical protein